MHRRPRKTFVRRPRNRLKIPPSGLPWGTDVASFIYPSSTLGKKGSAKREALSPKAAMVILPQKSMGVYGTIRVSLPWEICDRPSSALSDATASSGL